MTSQMALIQAHAGHRTADMEQADESGAEFLTRKIRELAHTRNDHAALKRTITDAQGALSYQLANELREERDLQQRCAALEALIQTAAVAEYGANGENSPALGVKVKLFDRLDYNKDFAFSWAKEKGMCLIPESLDVKAFEKIAKATDLPFVLVDVTPKAYIDSDLSKVIA